MADLYEIARRREPFSRGASIDAVAQAADAAVKEYVSRFGMPSQHNRPHIYHAIKTTIARRDEILKAQHG